MGGELAIQCRAIERAVRVVVSDSKCYLRLSRKKVLEAPKDMVGAISSKAQV